MNVLVRLYKFLEELDLSLIGFHVKVAAESLLRGAYTLILQVSGHADIVPLHKQSSHIISLLWVIFSVHPYIYSIL